MHETCTYVIKQASRCWIQKKMIQRYLNLSQIIIDNKLLSFIKLIGTLECTNK